MSTQRDFYEVLGVARDADADTIKKAYRKLAMQFHPDKNPGNKEAEDKFKEAASAYEVLSNADKRARYDRFGHQAFSGGAGGGQQYQDVSDIFASFGDIFGDIFGGMGGAGGGRVNRNRPRKGADLRYVVEISLKDVIQGIEKNIEFDTDEECSHCHGSGAEKGSTPETCTTCGGHGQVVRSQGFFQMASTCPHCGGTGEMIKHKCKSCKGSGREKVHRKIQVTIPAGVDNGTRLRVGQEGEGGYKGGPAGDLYVEMRVKEDDRFERRGDDLVGSIDVDYLQVALGAEIDFETVTGEIKVKIPSGHDLSHPIRVSHEGIPSLRGSRRGDLYLTLDVSFPHKLGKEEETLLREIAAHRKVEVSEAKSGLFHRKK